MKERKAGFHAYGLGCHFPKPLLTSVVSQRNNGNRNTEGSKGPFFLIYNLKEVHND